MHIHFIGICGTFMAGIARIACQMGYKVTGSDKSFYPPMSEQLKELGVETYLGYQADIWKKIKPDLVIVGNVCTRGMPIIESMLDIGIPYISGPKWLSDNVLNKRRVIAIAGTHGKTTTTAMLAHILLNSGLNIGYLIGGVTNGLDYSASLGNDEIFVIEADEYDSAYFDKRPKFIHYNPSVFVIGNIEYDHADIYSSINEIEKQFHYGIRLVPPSGHIILGSGESIDNVKSRGLWSNIFDETKAPFFYKKGCIIDNDSVKSLPDTIIGDHNKENAYRAMLAASIVGVDCNQSINTLKSFLGVKRRLEVIYLNNEQDIIIFEDFAHHPTAIEVTLKALKEVYPKHKLIAAVEPRSNTMKMGIFEASFKNIFEHTDIAYIFSKQNIKYQSPKIKFINDIDSLVSMLNKDIIDKTILVLMSNGDFYNIYQKIIDKVKKSTLTV